MRGEGVRIVVAAFTSSLIVIALGAGSAWWLDRVLTPLLRGTPGEILLVFAVAAFLGAGAAWAIIYTWLVRLLGVSD